MTRDVHEQHAVLTLFVTGDAPRSQRARANLASAVADLGLERARVCEVDLLDEPERTFEQGILATPALRYQGPHGGPEVLYGDLSERKRLEGFLRRAIGS